MLILTLNDMAVDYGLWTVDKMTMPGSFFYPFIF